MGKENQKDLSNIVFSLTEGSFNGTSRKKLITECIIFIILCVLATIFVVTALVLEYLNDSDKSIGSYVGTILIIVIGFSIMPLFFFAMLRRNERIRKAILLWVEDAAEIKAYCRSIGVERSLFVTTMKLQVEFTLEGKNYVRTTDRERRKWYNFGKPIGYFPNVSKFADREVKILYSPKYDEVMILKN